MSTATLLIVLVIVVGILILGVTKNFTSQNIALDRSILNENCKDLPNITDKYNCWEELLDLTLKEKGIEDAFSVIDNLYKNDPLFVEACHGYTHKLGEATYRLIIKGKDFDFPPQTASCGFGFFHGWLEHLFRDELDTKRAKVLCEHLDKSLSKELPRIRLNCYHTIGHGFITEPLDPKKWGNPYETIKPALKVCESITMNNHEITECIQGAFNVLADWMWRQDYGLGPIRPDNPFEFCEKQTRYEHELACYYEFAMHLNRIFDHDLARISKLVERISDDAIAQTVIDVVGAGLVIKMNVEGNYAKYIKACHSLQERLRKRCIIGMGGGFMAHAEPEKEYVGAIKFCESSELFVALIS